MSQSEKWHADRRRGVGGSDVQDVLNLPPYGCAARLFDTKRNLKPDFEPVRNPNMERGVVLEDIACEMFAKQENETIKVAKRIVSKEHPFMIGNIDREIIRADKNYNGILETKCPTRDNYLRIKRIGLPEYYITQMQHYLSVAGLKWGTWAIFCADMWELTPIPVERDEELIAMIIEAEENFWKLVENGPRPDRLEWGDKRCKSCNRKMSCWGDKIKELDEDYDEADDSDYEFVEDEELSEAYAEFLDDKETFKEAEELLEASKAKLSEVMGKRELIECDKGKINFKWQLSKRIDLNRLRLEEPEIAKRYEYEGLSRPLRPYPKKGI
jgi:putative phage-type endonuclease